MVEFPIVLEHACRNRPRVQEPILDVCRLNHHSPYSPAPYKFAYRNQPVSCEDIINTILSVPMGSESHLLHYTLPPAAYQSSLGPAPTIPHLPPLLIKNPKSSPLTVPRKPARARPIKKIRDVPDAVLRSVRVRWPSEHIDIDPLESNAKTLALMVGEAVSVVRRGESDVSDFRFLASSLNNPPNPILPRRPH